ncbi:cation:proton antiporter [Plectonema cf. radiosum LEGE 06105]|uniref:Cation:proton antiporter n=1 Tax=Plectonema cf. radiosum LEGE 06105 TaxID=945769 RepID=A0A8J7JZC2_9CYAN|nr:cation:proton antiporter [Plectonema radiosum]MBE9212251.1 cation:proton antiporter [Plectonema cf. radiosum LEGE 06105]
MPVTTLADLDPTHFNIALLALGGLIYIYALLSRFIKERLYLSAPILSVLLGVIFGPIGLNIFDVKAWGTQDIIVEQIARLTISIQLISTALRLRSAYPFSHLRSLAIFLGPLMLAMWIVNSALIYWILDIDFWVAVLIGAVVTPTDPVLAATIATGKFAEDKLPSRVRNLLSAESGLNDGLAYPFVFLPLLLLMRPPQEALSHWFSVIWLWDVGVAILFGLLSGYLAGKLLKLAQRKKLIDRQSFFTYVLALAFMVLGGVKLIGSDGILSVFMAGIGYDMVVEENDRINEENVTEALDLIVTVLIFTLFGLVIPWSEWLTLGWNGLFLVIAILVFRRLPALLLLNRFIPHTNGLKDALFIGWFGPIGVAAIYYANLTVHKTGIDQIWYIASLCIAGSVLVHGVTAVPLSLLYSQSSKNKQQNQEPET